MWPKVYHQGLAGRRYLEAETSFRFNASSSEPLSTNDKSLEVPVYNHVKINTRRVRNKGDAYLITRNGGDAYLEIRLRACCNHTSFSFGARTLAEMRDIVRINGFEG